MTAGGEDSETSDDDSAAIELGGLLTAGPLLTAGALLEAAALLMAGALLEIAAAGELSAAGALVEGPAVPPLEHPAASIARTLTAATSALARFRRPIIPNSVRKRVMSDIEA